MQQENEHAPEFQGVDTRSWTSFFRLAERWESAHSLDRIDMLYELLQGYLRGELWPTILPNVYGGTALTASPARPYWMKSARRWPIETFTRLDFLRAAKGFAGLHLHFQSESIKVDDATGRVVSRNYADDPFAAGHRGLIGISLDKYADSFIESYIKKLTPSPNAVVRWCSNHNWPVPSGLSCSETDVGAAGKEDHKKPRTLPANNANVPDANQEKSNRKRNVETDAILKNRIEMVLAAARRRWPDPKKRLAIDVMAKDLERLEREQKLPQKKRHGYKFETIRKILSGTYKTSIRHKIAGL